MAEVIQYMKLVDGVSGPILNMTTAAEDLAGELMHAASAAGKMDNGFASLGQSASRSAGLIGKVGEAFSNTIGQFALGNIAANAVMSIGSAVAALPGRIMAASDAYSGMQARLQLVAGSAEAASEMNDLIYQSALRARGSYEGMADAVGKIAMTAKDAFPDPREVVPFVEGIQKLFTIGGTGIQQQADAMLQLTQALGSGKLQGDEFRSIAEAAPMISQMIADYMGVSRAELKDLGAQGEITADTMKNAILSNMDVIEQKFETMPMTWGQAWQQMGTITTRAMQPVYDAISGLAGGPAMQSLLSAFAALMPVIGETFAAGINGAVWLGEAVLTVGSYVMDWLYAGLVMFGSLCETVFPYAAGALAMYAVWWEYANVGAQIQAVTLALVTARQWAVTAATTAWAAITGVLTARQWALNLALLANPTTWLIGLVFLAIGAFTAWIAATEGLRGAIAGAFGAIGDIAEKAVNFMIDSVNGLIKVLNAAANGINTVFGTNISTVGTIDWRASGWGGAASNFVKNFDPSTFLKGFMPQMPAIDASSYGGGSAALAMPDTGLGGGGGEGPAAKETAANTRGMLDAMGIMDEDLKFFRDVAEQEAINRYTTASVNINLGGVNQNISSGVDENDVLTHLVEQLQEAEEAGGEAVRD